MINTHRSAKASKLPPAMPIPLLDLKLQYASIREEILRVTAEVYDSQYFILGKRVEDFERDFAAYCHSRHCVGVSSGTYSRSTRDGRWR